MDYKTRDFLNVRTQPSTGAARIGMYRPGDKVTPLAMVTDGEGNHWHEVALHASTVRLLSVSGNGLAVGYCAHQYRGNMLTEPVDSGTVTPPPPTPARTFRTGVNIKTNFHLARQAAEAGCRYFMVIDDFGFASDLKQNYPDATVMVRRWFNNGRNITTVDQALQALEGANDPNLIYTLFNEGDHGRPMQQAAALEIALAREMKRRNGARLAVGTIAVGNPEFNDPEVCALVAACYAEAFNSYEVDFDYHLYSPNPMHIYQGPGETVWHERRYEFLYRLCGFNPSRVGGIYCGETGVDQGGVGGFNAHGMSGQQVIDWCNANRRIQTEPMVVDGVSYPSPVMGCALFQLGDRNTGQGGWAGYNVEQYLPELSTWWAQGG